jgi:O-antigen ligase
VAGAVGAVCAVGLIFTLTRAIWLASVCATVVMVLSLPALRRRLVPLLGGGVALVLVALAVVPGLGAKAQRRQDDQQPVWDRLNSDSAALRAIEDKPLLGVGWSRFGIASTPYFRQAADYPLTGVGIDAHNLFLSNAVELGLLGTLLWAIGLVGALGGAVAARAPPELALWRLGLVGLAIHWLVVANFGPVAYAFPNVLLWTWAGIVFGHRLTRTAAGAVVRPRGLPLLAEPDAFYAGRVSVARFGRPV